MATLRRRKHTQQSGRVTAEAVDAFDAGDRERLHRELRLPPWQASPLEAEGDCPWSPGSAGGFTWADSVALRAALVAA